MRTIERAYTDECMKVGIVGKNVRKELMELVAGLPAEFDAIGLKCKDLLSVIEYYGAFVEFSISRYFYSMEFSNRINGVASLKFRGRGANRLLRSILSMFLDECFQWPIFGDKNVFSG